jgi:hypothetical protein
MSTTYIIQVASYMKGQQSSTHTPNKVFFFKKSLATDVIKLPQIMVRQNQKQYKGSVSSAVVQDAAVVNLKTEESHKKSPLCIRINSHSKACL